MATKTQFKLTADESALLAKKLEYRFKKSGNPVVTKLTEATDLTDDELGLVINKLEYSFKKKGAPVIDKIKTHLGVETTGTKD